MDRESVAQVSNTIIAVGVREQAGDSITQEPYVYCPNEWFPPHGEEGAASTCRPHRFLSHYN